LFIRVFDDDGEFLLIESAHHIPKWLNPETSFNRVWIHCGKLHIIPLPISPGELSFFPNLNTKISLEKAISSIEQMKHKTGVFIDANTAIEERLKGYPLKIFDLQHRARCFLPIRIAFLLKECPQLVSAAVTAFYYRDVNALKVSGTF